MKKICFASASPLSIRVFMRSHILRLTEQYDVIAVSNFNSEDLLSDWLPSVRLVPIPIARRIMICADLWALLVLLCFFRREQFDVVHSVTPKAGLLALTAGWLVRIPVRVHIFTGQVWVTRRGPMRWILKNADKCIAFMATDVLVDSPSQLAFLIEQGVLSAEHSAVLGPGSICGVNTQRFCPSASVRKAVRSELSTSPNALVCLYLGRLNYQKGVLDLANAFAKAALNYPQVELWVVGPDEANWFEQMLVLLGDTTHQVKRVAFTHVPERFMQAADLFCLPSYREGFGSSVIEAAACGVPALASRIYGLTDAVAEGRTGWMHEVGNVQDLEQQLKSLFANPLELVIKGKAARRYAETVFPEEAITGAMLEFYKKRLHETPY